MSYYNYSSDQPRGFMAETPVTRNLLIVNIILFIAASVSPAAFDSFALYYPASEYFRPWQFVTYMFMHGGFAHLFFNMYSLWLFGAVVERILGTKRYLILYFAAGIGAALIHLGVEYLQYMSAYHEYVDKLTAYFALVSPDTDAAAIEAYAREHFVPEYLAVVGIEGICPPTVGASGAIYGLMMAFAMLNPKAEMMLIFPPVRLTARWMVIIFGGLELLTGIFYTSDGVAHFAHLGGMIFAFFLVLYWKQKLYRSNW